MQGTEAVEWPVARRYEGSDRLRVSLPVGGIGTGTVGFGGRGQFRDWELENHPSKGLAAPLTFLACRASTQGSAPIARILEGDLFDEEIEGALGSPVGMAGIPRFEQCSYQTSYPFGQVSLQDRSFPLQVAVEAFNPLWPGDVEFSGLPIMIIRALLTNTSADEVDASLMFSVEDLVGHRLRSSRQPSRPVASTRESGGARGYLLGDDALDVQDEEWGTLAAAVLDEDGWVGPTWDVGKWNQGLLAMWEGYLSDGVPPAEEIDADSIGMSGVSGRDQSIAATMGADRTIAPGETASVRFLLAWHFPNRRAWTWGWGGPAGGSGTDIVGNAYANLYDDAWGVIEQVQDRVDEFRDRTATFVSAFLRSDLDPAVKEAALFNLSTLRSQTFFRTADGRPFGWEGCLDDVGSCLGSCTHVWNYDLATPFVFAPLARKMRELEYERATGPDGAMSFRIMLPLSRAREWPTTAADGQFGCVVKLHREWQLSGDDEWLRRLWPSCRKSLEFAWIEGGWDGDQDGVAEGTQHNTMDVEYYGPNPPVQSWYLAALSAAAEMARAVDDHEFAARCQDLFASGVPATEKLLFNGEYYRQEIIPPGDFARIAPQLRHESMGAVKADDPEFQIGEGCQIDQLVGDTYGRVAGLSPILDAGHVTTALDSIHRHNYIADFGDWTNGMRTYAGRGERGHLVTSYPGTLPEHPMPYWSEVWTGLEYVYATGLAYAGRPELAVDVVRAARERYSGRRRNPYDEEECGHHYARAMSGWGVVVALTGFGYDGRSRRMSFAPVESTTEWFWSTGDAWGMVRQDPADGGGRSVRLEVIGGSVWLDSVRIGDTDYPVQADGALGPGVLDLSPGTPAG
jgi:non-lysosomal glucosylceramidase